MSGNEPRNRPGAPNTRNRASVCDLYELQWTFSSTDSRRSASCPENVFSAAFRICPAGGASSRARRSRFSTCSESTVPCSLPISCACARSWFWKRRKREPNETVSGQRVFLAPRENANAIDRRTRAWREMTTARRAAREARGAWGASRRRAGDERVRRMRVPTSARHARRPGAGLLARCGATTRDRPLLDGSSERPGFQKPRADISSGASFLRLDAPVAATPFAASAPLFRACFGTSWGVRRELRGGNTRALPRVRASERSDDKKKNRGSSRGARLGHQLSELADLAKNNEREPNRA